MNSGPSQIHPFLAEGTVAEIFEASGEPRVRVVLKAGMMLDLPAHSVPDLHLGQQVDMGGYITVEFLSTRAVRVATDPSA
jgi:hypothetical protein